MKIGEFETSDRVLIIAEIGNNHEGDRGRAEAMIAAAAEAGADAVKFQTIVPERLVHPSETARLAQLGRLCLSYEDFGRLAEAASRCGVLFLSTPFDLDSVRFLEPLVPGYKIASGDNDFVPLLEAVARTTKPVILSTGLLGISEVVRSKACIERVWAQTGKAGALALLHCVSAYPTPPEEANLGAIRDLAGLGCTVGYSDHTIGIEAAVLSVGLGGRIIEKHFTLDKNLSDFRDHKLSADPADLKTLVRRVREAETMIGSAGKQPMASESASGASVRRSIVAGRDLAAGHVLAFEDLNWLRPGGGMEPGREGEILGRTLRKGISAGDRLTAEAFE
ncbi:MAG: N-acetylneuraminate synthase family protein [Acetobacterales bacterium]